MKLMFYALVDNQIHTTEFLRKNKTFQEAI